MNSCATRVILGGLFAISSMAVFAQSPPAPKPPPSTSAARPNRPVAGGGTVSGTVTDDTGGVIPNATVTLTAADGTLQTTTTQGDGSYSFKGVPSGAYTITADFTGFAPNSAVPVQVAPGRVITGDIVMKVQATKQEVTVASETNSVVSTDPTQNAGALVLRKEDLDSLPDDPDDLEQDLQALAGPSAGPGGAQIYIDGFTGGRLPPKESIREIRINQNPFSAEYDKLGFGRIEILTKPGSDKFHGQGLYSVSDDVWNSRNPFIPEPAPFMTQLFSGNVSGPINSHASFFIDAERRMIDDNAIINAVELGPAPTFTPYNNQSFYPTPQRRTTVSPRIDYQLNANNTLSFRYAWLENDQEVSGIGQFDLPSNALKSVTREQTGQVTETAILSSKVINETRFQFDSNRLNQDAFESTPTLTVANAFTSGTANVGNSYNITNSYELQNYTSLAWGAHNSKFGIRVRASTIWDHSDSGFIPTYIYSGRAIDPENPAATLAPILQYQRFLLLQQAGASQAQILASGAGPSQLSMVGGTPYAQVSQVDWGVYFQDDWRLRPNLTISTGLRYEGQTNINDKNDWAPRLGFAWSPGAAAKTGRPKTVIRGGFGIFYDRFAANNVLNTILYNGINQTQYVLQNPPFLYPYIPSISELQAQTNLKTYQIDSSLRSPYVLQTALGVERQVAKNTTITVNYTNTRGVHEFRTRDINAPNPFVNYETVYGPPGLQLDNYESTGFFRQNQLMTNVNSRIGSWFTLFGGYVFSHANSDTDGLGTFPANQWNLHPEYGRSSLDIENRLFLGGSVTTWKQIRLSPFIVARTGIPFNIITGNVDPITGLVTIRPGVASGPGPGIIATPYGYLDPTLLATESMLARNAGNGPPSFSLNLRLSRTWGFGTTKFAGNVGGARSGQGGGRMGGRGMGFGDPVTEHRYNLTLSINARNVLNNVNLNQPIGALVSGRFLDSTGISGGFGAEQTSAENRRIDLQLRFQF
jgi:Carboxypeptidase regulatory-like domain/TonB dependent receptor